MHHSVDHIVRVRNITEDPGTGRTDIGAGSQLFTLGEAGVKAEVTLIDGMPFGIKVTGLIGESKFEGLVDLLHELVYKGQVLTKRERYTHRIDF